MALTISFRQYDFKIKRNLDKDYIFDVIRKKWLLLTPEEKVRQLWIHHLIFDLNYSPNRIGLEKSFILNNRRKRIDIVYYNEDHKPELIIECKAPTVHIDFSTLEQLLNYNGYFGAKKLIITNGDKHLGMKLQNNQFIPIASLK